MITAIDIYNHTECPRRVYLNKHGDQTKKKPVSSSKQKLMLDGIQHEKKVVEDMKYAEVVYGDKDEGFKMTYYLMSTGTPIIYHGILKYDGMVGEPDLLIKVKGRSKFGQYHYAPCDIKSSKQLKDHHKMQLMFYAHLLHKIQGTSPAVSSIINASNKDIAFKTNEEKKVFEKKLNELQLICENKIQFEPILIPSCTDCSWQEFCAEAAQKKKDLSLIYKLTGQQRELLISKDIKDIKDLAKADVIKLARNKSLHESTILKWKLQAEALLKNKAITLKQPSFEKVRTEIFFDMEGDQNTEYLLGALVKQGKKERYVSFWADSVKEEEKIFQEFCKYLDGLKEFKLYHYASHEKTALKKLASKYKISKKTIAKIEKNMIDLFPLLTKSAVLPLTSYSLKPVVKYLGFNWDDENDTVCEYSAWLETKDNSLKEKILTYNQKDCQALSILKDWLMGLK